MRTIVTRRWMLGWLGILLALAPFTAGASVYTVNSTGESVTALSCTDKLSSCTLRAAITKANVSSSPDTIRFDLDSSNTGCDSNGNCTITLNSALPNVSGNLTIEGPTTTKLFISRSTAAGTADFRIFTIDAGFTVAFSNLRITNGRVSNGGGGIWNDGSQVTLRNCYLSANTANYGGGIWNGSFGQTPPASHLKLIDCTLSQNVVQHFQQFDQADGGGIYNSGVSQNATIEAINCVFSENFAPGFGGALVDNGGATITDSTFQANTAAEGGAIMAGAGTNAPPQVVTVITGSTFSGNGLNGGQGGAVGNLGSRVTMTNCTLSGNVAANGGGVDNGFGGTLTLKNCTFSGNSSANASGGMSLRNTNAIVEVVNTIFERTGSNANLANDVSQGGRFTSLGHNLSDDAAGGPLFTTSPGGLLNATGDQRNSTPGLAALANNGGPTQTHAINSKSDAFNKGDDTLAPKYDQRGFVRSSVSDVGAFESGGQAKSLLANISTRLRVETGDNALIAGFIVTGTQAKKVIVRGIGPSLSFGGILANPTLELHDSSAGALLSTNDDWVTSPNKQAIIDSGIPPSNDLESAIVATLPAETTFYTAILRGVNDGTGIGVVQLYDLDGAANSKLANISTRGLVGTDDNVLIAGTIVLGQPVQKVIVRAIGPSLAVPGAMANPTLELRDGNGGVIRANDDWRTGGQETEINATGIPPTNDQESAIVADLPANAATYTAIVSGSGNTTGIAVVEIYRLD